MALLCLLDLFGDWLGAFMEAYYAGYENGRALKVLYCAIYELETYAY